MHYTKGRTINEQVRWLLGCGTRDAIANIRTITDRELLDATLTEAQRRDTRTVIQAVRRRFRQLDRQAKGRA